MIENACTVYQCMDFVKKSKKEDSTESEAVYLVEND